MRRLYVVDLRSYMTFLPSPRFHLNSSFCHISLVIGCFLSCSIAKLYGVRSMRRRRDGRQMPFISDPSTWKNKWVSCSEKSCGIFEAKEKRNCLRRNWTQVSLLLASSLAANELAKYVLVNRLSSWASEVAAKGCGNLVLFEVRMMTSTRQAGKAG